jgi:hypothetical protein
MLIVVRHRFFFKTNDSIVQHETYLQHRETRSDNHRMAKMNNNERIATILPTHIGGPGTRMPRFLESILSWAFAIGCLGVALWHYQVDRYWTRIASGSTDIREAGKPQHRRHFLPLTTHSHREWLTVSESYQGLRTRYHQLLELIYTGILATQTKLPNEENIGEEEEESLDDNEYVIVDGNTCQENKTRKKEEQPSSVGEVVAKWLSTGLMVVSTTLRMTPSTTPTKRSNPDKSDSLHCHNSLETLIGLIRTNEAARRLASLLLGEDPIHVTATSSTNSASDTTITKRQTRKNKEKWLERLSSEQPGADAVLQALREIWSRLLELPASLPPAHESDCHNNTETIAISMIVPSFREDGGQLASKIQGSLEHAIEPHRIEIIIVHVMEKDQYQEAEDRNSESFCENLSSFEKTIREQIVSTKTVVKDCSRRTATRPSSVRPVLRILEYHGGGGRGPCLNFGAKHARGSILTFLHGDTRLATYGWDKEISKALEEDGSDGSRTTCCAFSFAIDTSPEALTVRTTKTSDCSKEESWDCNESSHYQQYYPPGLRAIEVTANLRCKLFSLPYGDQCLSLPTAVFRYIGGYPDQCLMEDYELIRLLRMRSAASLARHSVRILGSDSDRGQETVELLSDHKALCSPRRWQNYGVLYVTYTNSYCVKRYNNGEVTPDELFCEYYGTTAPPNRMNGERSPWEAGLRSYNYQTADETKID